MTKTKPWAQLRDTIEDTPERRILAAQYRRAMDTADALGKLLDERSGPAQQLGDTSSATRVEHNEDEYFSALRNYVELLGGELEIKAVFADQTVTLVPSKGAV